jgi:membrane-bound ClpP family serine protease
LASIILASQTFIRPRNSYQFEQFQTSLMVLAGAAVGTIVAAVLMNRWLPKAPIVSDMVLSPPEGEEAEERRRREALVEYSELVGQKGTTTTQLTPSGKAMFDDELLDVITDGEVIDRGIDVVVVEVQGNRVLVRAAEDDVTPR